MAKNIVVTGAGGLVGRRLVRRLSEQEQDAKIIAVTRSGSIGVEQVDNVDYLSGDLREIDVWESIPTDITHLIHLAAVIPWAAEHKSRPELFGDNLAPLCNFMKVSDRWGRFEAVIYGSSVAIYSPLNYYAFAKLAGERMLETLKQKGTRVISLRFSSIYGFGQHQASVLPTMIRAAMETGEITLFGKGERTQDFVYCEDAAQACIDALNATESGTYDIGSGRPVSMVELAETIREVFTNGAADIAHHHNALEGESAGYNISDAKRAIGYLPEYDIALGLAEYKDELARSGGANL